MCGFGFSLLLDEGAGALDLEDREGVIESRSFAKIFLNMRSGKRV